MGNLQHTPWAFVAAILVATTALVALTTWEGWPSLLVAAVAALATCVGAMAAPATFTAPPPPAGEWRRRKSWQLAIAGLVTVATGIFLQETVGVAAIFGIVGAMLYGAVAPRAAADENATRERTDP